MKQSAEHELLMYTKLQQQKEQELRDVALGRQRQLELLIKQREEKLKEQDIVIFEL